MINTNRARHAREARNEQPGLAALAGFAFCIVAAATVAAQIPAEAYEARRAAALVAARDNLIIVPARASFLADEQLGFVQASDFQYLSGLGDRSAPYSCSTA